MSPKRKFNLSVAVSCVSLVAVATIACFNDSEIGALAKYTFQLPVNTLMNLTIQTDTSLASQQSWYKGTVPVSEITSVQLVRELPTNIPVDETWDASEEQNQGITCYLSGTDLYICSNGEDTIVANQDATGMFEGFENIPDFIGLDMLDTSKVQTMDKMFKGCESITAFSFYSLNTDSVQSMEYMFANCEKLTKLDTAALNTTSVHSLRGMFSGCTSLTTLDFSELDLSSVQNLDEILKGCSSLSSISLSNKILPQLISMNEFAANCTSLVQFDVNGLDCPMLASANSIVSGCTKLQQLVISNFSAPKMSDLVGVFQGNNSLQSIELTESTFPSVSTLNQIFQNMPELNQVTLRDLNISGVESVSSMFMGASVKSVDLQNIDFSNLNMVSDMFTGATLLESIQFDNVNLSGVTDFANIFKTTPQLKSVSITRCDFSNTTAIGSLLSGNPVIESVALTNNNFSAVQNLSGIFYSKSSLENVDFSGNDFSKVDSMSSMFYGCTNIKQVNFSNCNLSNLQQTNAMFYNCENLVSVDFTGAIISKIQQTQQMFANCKALNQCNFFDVASPNQLVNIFNTFQNCVSLGKIEFSDKEFSNLTNVAQCFNGAVADSVKFNNCTFPALLNASVMIYGLTANTIEFVDCDFSNVLSASGFGAFLSTESLVYRGCDFRKLQDVSPLFRSQTKATSLTIDNCNLDAATDLNFSGLESVDNLHLKNLTMNSVNKFSGMNSSKLSSVSIENVSFPNATSTGGTGGLIVSSSVESLYIDGLDLSSVKDATCMFGQASNLESITLLNLNISSATKAVGMFQNDYKIKEIDLSGIKWGELESIQAMFMNCYELTGIDFSCIPTESLKTMNSAFMGCKSLSDFEIDTKSFPVLTDMGSFFTGSGVKNVAFRNVDFPAFTYAPYLGFPSNMELVEFINVSIPNVPSINSMLILGTKEMVLENVSLDSLNELSPIFVSANVTDKLTVKNLKIPSAKSLFPVSYIKAAVFELDGVYAPNADLVRFMMYSPSVQSFTFNSIQAATPTSLLSAFVNSSLTSFDLSMFDLSNVTDITSFLEGCTNAQVINIPSLDGTNLSVDTSKTYFANTGKNSSSITWYVKDKLTADFIRSLLTEEQAIKSTFIYDGVTDTWIDLSAVIPNEYRSTATALIIGGDKPVSAEESYSIGNGVFVYRTGNEFYLPTTNLALHVENMNNTFAGCSSLNKIEGLEYIDYTFVKEWVNTFKGCSSLVSLDLAKVQSTPTIFISTFEDCINLVNLDLSGINTSDAETLVAMFKNCINLSNLQFALKGNNIYALTSMYDGCASLSAIDLSGVESVNLFAINNLMKGCTQLQTVKLPDLSGLLNNPVDMTIFDWTGLFEGCENLVYIDATSWSYSDYLSGSLVPSLFDGNTNTIQWIVTNDEVASSIKTALPNMNLIVTTKQ